MSHKIGNTVETTNIKKVKSYFRPIEFILMEYEVIIIGAGPVGSTVAETIGREGHKVLVLEEHLEVGSPTHCTGKLSVNAVKELNLEPQGILNEVNGANFYSPNGQSFHIERNETQAYIFDRKIFDATLAKKALNVGVKILTETRALDFIVTNEGVKVLFTHRGNTKQQKAKIIVGADGANTMVARRVGLYSKKTSELTLGVQKEVLGIKKLQKRTVELFFGQKYAPGFFAWIVPTGKESARVGLGVKPRLGVNPKKYLDKFIMEHPTIKDKFEGCSTNKTTVHIIPTGGTLHQTVSDGIMIVGDAAGHIKSTTGGGLYYGMLCAKIAGKIISKNLEASQDNVLRKTSLMEYQRLWQARLNKEIQYSTRLRTFLTSLTDGEMNYLFKVLISSPLLFNEIIAQGDLDWQSKIATRVINSLLKTLIKRPMILFKMGKHLV
jgi:geranylgeranyl reductase family protein